MKKFTGIYKKYMLRPILYKTVLKLAVCAVLVLLWDRFLNTAGFSVTRYGCFCVGGITALLAWFEYLRLDGMVVKPLSTGGKKKKAKRRTGDLSDYTEEEVISYGDLEPEERALCRLLSDLLCGGILLIPGIVGLFL